jgi:hypothetical protein
MLLNLAGIKGKHNLRDRTIISLNHYNKCSSFGLKKSTKRSKTRW